MLRKHAQNKTKRKRKKKRERKKKIYPPHAPHFPNYFSLVAYLFLHQNPLGINYLRY